MGVSNWAKFGENGAEVANPVFPYRLRFQVSPNFFTSASSPLERLTSLTSMFTSSPRTLSPSQWTQSSTTSWPWTSRRSWAGSRLRLGTSCSGLSSLSKLLQRGKLEMQVRDDHQPVGRPEVVDKARRRSPRPGSQT